MSTHLENTAAPEEKKNTASPLERMSQAWVSSMFDWNKGLMQASADFGNLYTKTIASYMSNQTPAKVLEGMTGNPFDMVRAYVGMNETLMDAWFGASQSAMEYTGERMKEFLEAAETGDPEKMAELFERQAEILDMVANKKPEMREKIKAEYGLHFENEKEYRKVSESPRAVVYQVVPLERGVEVDMSAKPALFVSPFILTDGIQGILPHEGVSLVHSFANKGTPTYIVHYKDILETPEVQTMKIEDVIDDIGQFAGQLKGLHQREVTVVGTCQGAAVALAGGISGKWKGTVDAIIQNVPPNDLSRSPEWKKYLATVPPSQQDIDNITVTLPNGNKVILGEAASLSMRLKNIRETNPFTSFVNEIKGAGSEKGVTKFGLAIEAWLGKMVPLPYFLSKDFSELTARTPIGDDPNGKMPYKLYGQEAHLSSLMGNVKYIHAIGGDTDDVCSPEVVRSIFEHPALRDNPNATVVFVKGGHIVPMTSAVIKGNKPGGVYAENGSYFMHQKFDKLTRPEEKEEEEEEWLMAA